MSHSLRTGWPEIFAGVKSQCFAACTAASLKNRLGDEAGIAVSTAPDALTRTLRITRTVPWIVLRALDEISGITWFSGAPCVTGPAGKLVGATAAVRDVAGSGAIEDAARAAEVLEAGADAALFSGVRSLAGVEVGVALAGGCVDETCGPSNPPWLGADVEGFADGVESGLLFAGGCAGSEAGCAAGADEVGCAGCADGWAAGAFEITLCVNSRTCGT
jgi:hypothetical protein